MSQIAIMGVLCYAKVLIFTLVSLLVDFTNLVKADSLQLEDKVYNYDSYEYYPGYPNPNYPGYPDSKSTLTNKRTTLLFRTFCYFKREEVTLSFSIEITNVLN